MRRYILAAGFVGWVTATVGWAAGASVPATATFRDTCAVDFRGQCGAGSDRIRSDSFPPLGQYQDGVTCVKSEVSGNGFFMRTARYGCSPYTRALTVDFSDHVALALGVDCSIPVLDAYGDPGTLNVCGSNSIPDARFIASNLFAAGKASANGTPLILVLNLFPDHQHNQFELDFEQNQPITVLSPTARTLGLPTGSTLPLPIADLYRISGSSKKTLLGQYRMPFQVTVQE